MVFAAPMPLGRIAAVAECNPRSVGRCGGSNEAGEWFDSASEASKQLKNEFQSTALTPVMGLVRREDEGGEQATVSTGCWDWVMGFRLSVSTTDDAALLMQAGALLPAENPTSDAGSTALDRSPMLVAGMVKSGPSGTAEAPPTTLHGEKVIDFMSVASMPFAIAARVVFNTGAARFDQQPPTGGETVRWIITGAQLQPQPEAPGMVLAAGLCKADSSPASNASAPRLFAAVNAAAVTTAAPASAYVRLIPNTYSYFGPFESGRDPRVLLTCLRRDGSVDWNVEIDLGTAGGGTNGQSLGVRSMLATRDHLWVAGIMSSSAGIAFRRTSLAAAGIPNQYVPSPSDPARCQFSSDGSAGSGPRPFLFRFDVVTGNPHPACAAWVGARAAINGESGLLLQAATLLRANFSAVPASLPGEGAVAPWGRSALVPSTSYDGLWGVAVFCGALTVGTSSSAQPFSLGAQDPAHTAHPGLPSGARSQAVCLAVEDSESGYGAGKLLWVHTIGAPVNSQDKATGVVGGHLASGFSEAAGWAGATEQAAQRGQGAAALAAQGDDHLWVSLRLPTRASQGCQIDSTVDLEGLCDRPSVSGASAVLPAIWHLDPMGTTLAVEPIGDPDLRHNNFDDTMDLRAGCLLPPVSAVAADGTATTLADLPLKGARGTMLLLIGSYPSKALDPLATRRRLAHVNETGLAHGGGAELGRGASRARRLLSASSRDVWGLDGDTWAAAETPLGMLDDEIQRGGPASTVAALFGVAPRPAPSLAFAKLPDLIVQTAAVPMRLVVDGVTASLGFQAGLPAAGQPSLLEVPTATGLAGATRVVVRDVTAQVDAISGTGAVYVLPSQGTSLADAGSLRVDSAGNDTAAAAFAQGRWVGPPGGGFALADIAMPGISPQSTRQWVLVALEDNWGRGSAAVFPVYVVAPGANGEESPPLAAFALPSTRGLFTTRNVDSLTPHVVCSFGAGSSGQSDPARTLLDAVTASPAFDLPSSELEVAALISAVQWRVDGGAWTDTSPTADAAALASCRAFSCPPRLSASSGLSNGCSLCASALTTSGLAPQGTFAASLQRTPSLTWETWDVEARCCGGSKGCTATPAALQVILDRVPPRASVDSKPSPFDRSSTAQFAFGCDKTDSIGEPRAFAGGCAFRYRVAEAPFAGIDSQPFTELQAQEQGGSDAGAAVLLDDLAKAACLATRVEVVVAAGPTAPGAASQRQFRLAQPGAPFVTALSSPLAPSSSGPAVPTVNSTLVGFRVVTAVPAGAFSVRLSLDLRGSASASLQAGVLEQGQAGLSGTGRFVSLAPSSPALLQDGVTWAPGQGSAPATALSSSVLWLDDSLSALLAQSGGKLSATVHLEALASVVDTWAPVPGRLEPVSVGASVIVDNLPPSVVVTSLPPTGWAYDAIGGMGALPAAASGFGLGALAMPAEDGTAAAASEESAWWGAGAGVATVACSAAERAPFGGQSSTSSSIAGADPAGQACLVRYRVNAGPVRSALAPFLPVPKADVVNGVNTLVIEQAFDSAGNEGAPVQATWEHNATAAAAAIAARPAAPQLLHAPGPAVSSGASVVVLAKPAVTSLATPAPAGLSGAIGPLRAAGIVLQSNLVGPFSGAPAGAAASGRGAVVPSSPPVKAWAEVAADAADTGTWRPTSVLAPGRYRLWLRTAHSPSGVTSQTSTTAPDGCAFVDFAVLQPQRFLPSAAPPAGAAVAMAGGAEGASPVDLLARSSPSSAAAAFVPAGAVAVASRLPCVRLAATAPSASAAAVRDVYVVLADCQTPTSAMVTTTSVAPTAAVSAESSRPAAPEDAMWPQCTLEVQLQVATDPAESARQSVTWGGFEFLVGSYSSSPGPSLSGVTVEAGTAPGAKQLVLLFASDSEWPLTGTAHVGTSATLPGNVTVAGVPGSAGASAWEFATDPDGKPMLRFGGSSAPTLGVSGEELSGAGAARLVAGDGNATALARALLAGHTWRQGIRLSIRRLVLPAWLDDFVILFRSLRPGFQADSTPGQNMHPTLRGLGLRATSSTRFSLVRVDAGRIVETLFTNLACKTTSGALWNIVIEMEEDLVTVQCDGSSSTPSQMTARTMFALGTRQACGVAGGQLELGTATRMKTGPMLRVSELPFTTSSSQHRFLVRPVCRGIHGQDAAVSLQLQNPAATAGNELVLTPETDGGLLRDGRWKIQVLAADGVGNAQVPANATSYEWVIDSSSPVSTVSVSPVSQAQKEALGQGAAVAPGPAGLLFGAVRDALAAESFAAKVTQNSQVGAVPAMQLALVQEVFSSVLVSLDASVPLAQRAAQQGVALGVSPLTALTRANDAPSISLAIQTADTSDVVMNLSVVFVPGAVLSPEQVASASLALPASAFVRLNSQASGVAVPVGSPTGTALATFAGCLPRLPADTLTPGWPQEASSGAGGALPLAPSASCLTAPLLPPEAVVPVQQLQALGVVGLEGARLAIASPEQQVAAWLEAGGGPSTEVATAQGTLLVRAVAEDAAGNTEANVALPATAAVAVDRSPPAVTTLFAASAIRGDTLPAMISIDFVASEPRTWAVIALAEARTGTQIGPTHVVAAPGPNVTDAASADGPRRWRLRFDISSVAALLDSRGVGQGPLTEAFVITSAGVDRAGNRGPTARSIGWVDRELPSVRCLSNASGAHGFITSGDSSVLAAAGLAGLAPLQIPVISTAATAITCLASEPIAGMEARVRAGYGPAGAGDATAVPPAASLARAIVSGGAVQPAVSASDLGTPLGTEFAAMSVETDFAALVAAVSALDPSASPQPPEHPFTLRISGLGETPQDPAGRASTPGTLLVVELRVTDMAGNVGAWAPVPLVADRSGPQLSIKGTNRGLSQQCPSAWTSRFAANTLLVPAAEAALDMPDLAEDDGLDSRCARTLPLFRGMSAGGPLDANTFFGDQRMGATATVEVSGEAQSLAQASMVLLDEDSIALAAATPQANGSSIPSGLGQQKLGILLGSNEAGDPASWRGGVPASGELVSSSASSPYLIAAQTAAAAAHVRLQVELEQAVFPFEGGWSTGAPAPPRQLPAQFVDSFPALVTAQIAWPPPNETAMRAAAAVTSLVPGGKRGLALPAQEAVFAMRNGPYLMSTWVAKLVVSSAGAGGPGSTAGVGAARRGVLAMAVTMFDAGGVPADRSLAFPFVLDRDPPRARLGCAGSATFCAAISASLAIDGAQLPLEAPAAESNGDPALWTSGNWTTAGAEASGLLLAGAPATLDWLAAGGLSSTAAGQSLLRAPFPPGSRVPPAVQSLDQASMELTAMCGEVAPATVIQAQRAGARWQPGGYLDDRCVMDVMIAYRRHQQARTPPPIRTAVVYGTAAGSLSRWTSGLGPASSGYRFAADSWRDSAPAANKLKPTLPEQQADDAGPSDGLYAVRVRGVDAAGNPGAWTDWLRFAVDTVAPSAVLLPLLPPPVAVSDDTVALQRAAEGEAGSAALGAASRRGSRAFATAGTTLPGMLVTCGEAALDTGGELSPLSPSDLSDLGGGCRLQMVVARAVLASSACGPTDGTSGSGGGGTGSLLAGSVVSNGAALGTEVPAGQSWLTLRRGGEEPLYTLDEVTPAELAASAAHDAAEGFGEAAPPGTPASVAAFGPLPTVASQRGLTEPTALLATPGLRFFRLQVSASLAGSDDTLSESVWLRSVDAANNVGEAVPTAMRRDATAPPAPEARTTPADITAGLLEYRYELWSALSVLDEAGTSIVPAWRTDDAAVDGSLLYGLSADLEARVTSFQGAGMDDPEGLLPGQFRALPEACAELEEAVRASDMAIFSAAQADPWEGVFFRFRATFVGAAGNYPLTVAPAGAPAAGEYWACATGPLVLKGLPDGTTSIRIKAVDAAGNEGPSRVFSTVVSSQRPQSVVRWTPPARTSLRRVALAVDVTLGGVPATFGSVAVVHRRPAVTEAQRLVPIAASPDGVSPSTAVVVLQDLEVGRHSVTVFAQLGDSPEDSSTRPPAIEFEIADCSTTQHEALDSSGELLCEACPPGADCSHPRTALADMPALPGWWSSGQMFGSGLPRRFYLCESKAACRGGRRVSAQYPAVPPPWALPQGVALRALYDAYLPPGSVARAEAMERAAIATAMLGGSLDAYNESAPQSLGGRSIAAAARAAAAATSANVSTCGFGHTGLLCSQCEDGFFLSFQQCAACPPERSQAFALTAGIIAGLGALALLFLRLRRFLPIIQAKVILAFAQILAATVTAYDIPWPVEFGDTVNALRIFVLDIVQATRVQCAQPVGFLESFHAQAAEQTLAVLAALDSSLDKDKAAVARTEATLATGKPAGRTLLRESASGETCADKLRDLTEACCGCARSADEASEPSATWLGAASASCRGIVSRACIPCEEAAHWRTAARLDGLRRRQAAELAQQRASAEQRSVEERLYFALTPRERIERDSHTVTSAAMLRLLLLLAMVVFAPVSLACLRMLRCVEVDGERRLLADLRQPCSGVLFRSHELYAVVVLLAFTAGFPLALVLYIRRNLVALRQAAERERQARDRAEARAVGESGYESADDAASSSERSLISRQGSSQAGRLLSRPASGSTSAAAEPTVSLPPSPAAASPAPGSPASSPAAAKRGRGRGPQREGVLDRLHGTNRARLDALMAAAVLRAGPGGEAPAAAPHGLRAKGKGGPAADAWLVPASLPDDVAAQERRERRLAALVYAPSGTLPGPARQELFTIRERHAVMLRVGSMYEGYTPRAYWWEAEELLRRLALSALIVLVPSGSSLQVAVATLIAAAVLALLNLVEPYQDPAAQRLQQLAFATILFVFWTGMLLKTDAAAAAERAAAGGASDVDSDTDRLVIRWLGFCMVALTLATIVTGVVLFVRDTARNMLAASVQSSRRRGSQGRKSPTRSTGPTAASPLPSRAASRAAASPRSPGRFPHQAAEAKALAEGTECAPRPGTAAEGRARPSGSLVASIDAVRFGLRSTVNPAQSASFAPGRDSRSVGQPIRARSDQH
ncbi:hypothetical protein FNF27_04947 [Cafeteria roenbergensis]|uniref:Uncharacterized protein n=1 Tax=Cafeteria roenbergensis TaxID=33653 RepID=A0A5A8E747_CAFRO|nr:hypothetical protein FNF27_04947 [Cafeteria roenbergensis]